ncbi:unnamed protein product, partial [Rotaria sp. Silwood2]
MLLSSFSMYHYIKVEHKKHIISIAIIFRRHNYTNKQIWKETFY